MKDLVRDLMDHAHSDGAVGKFAPSDSTLAAESELRAFMAKDQQDAEAWRWLWKFHALKFQKFLDDIPGKPSGTRIPFKSAGGLP